KNTVSVNHKALVTRALTKYPVDFALFRELLQNSADAQAHTATISFESKEVITDPLKLHQCSISKLSFSNDGLEFINDDWNRLREIASGNPNETKIGAFGVGFYSVFELTDEPLVHSGNSIMSFQYEGVQLQYFVNQTTAFHKGTLIDLPYKADGTLPDLVKFVGFLIQSFLLVNLMEVNLEVKCANKTYPLLNLSKQRNNVADMISLPPSINPKSPNGVFKVQRLGRTDYKISIKYLNATQSAPLTLSSGWFSLGKQIVKSLSQSSGDPNDYTSTEDPQMVFRNAEDTESYELLLAYLAANWDSIKANTQLVESLKVSPFLLGYKHINIPQEHTEKENGAGLAGEASLYSSKQLVIVDNVIIFNQFKGKVISAPQTEILEPFYSRLGVPNLTSLLKQTVYFGTEVDKPEETEVLSKRVKERLGLFLDNTSKQVARKSLNFDVKFISQIEFKRE
ncbi:hypothetical protein FF38_09207, partial [Lucilia cuprina]